MSLVDNLRGYYEELMEQVMSKKKWSKLYMDDPYNPKKVQESATYIGLVNEYDRLAKEMTNQKATDEQLRQLVGSFDPAPSKVPCAACGVPMDKHGVAMPGKLSCPRYVKPPNLQPSVLTHPSPFGNPPPSPNQLVGGGKVLPGIYQWFDPNDPQSRKDASHDAFTVSATVVRKLEEQMNHLLRVVDSLNTCINQQAAHIAKLEKAQKSYDFNPRIERAMRERPDYTQWVDEEECLTSVERGPVPKEKVIFSSDGWYCAVCDKFHKDDCPQWAATTNTIPF